MKKLLLSVSIFLFALAGTAVLHADAEEGKVDVKVTTHFDEENEIEIPLEADYGTKVAFDGALEDDEDYEFAYWIVNGVVSKHLDADHDFVVRSKMELTAIFKPVDQHVVSFMDTNGDLLDIQYADEGDPVAYEGLEYPDKPKLKVVEEEPWGDVNLDSITEDKILVLNYERNTDATFTLILDIPGVAEDEATYNYNDIATYEVPEAALELFDFDYWTIDGKIVSYDLTISFSMLEDRELKAHFNGGAEPEPIIIASENLNLRSGYTSHLAQFYLPEDYELVEYGFVATPHAFDNVTLGTEGVERIQGDKFFGPTNEFLMSLDEEEVQNPRAYLVYRDGEGNLGTVYSESKHGVVAEREIEEREGPDMATMWIIDPSNGYILDWTPYVDDQPIDGVTVQEDGSIYATRDVIEQINYVELDDVLYSIDDFEDTFVVGDD